MAGMLRGGHWRHEATAENRVDDLDDRFHAPRLAGAGRHLRKKIGLREIPGLGVDHVRIAGSVWSVQDD